MLPNILGLGIGPLEVILFFIVPLICLFFILRKWETRYRIPMFIVTIIFGWIGFLLSFVLLVVEKSAGNKT